MAEGVVVLLEAVEVEQQQRPRLAARRKRELVLQVGQQAAPVPQAGERVGAGLGVGLRQQLRWFSRKASAIRASASEAPTPEAHRSRG